MLTDRPTQLEAAPNAMRLAMDMLADGAVVAFPDSLESFQERRRLLHEKTQLVTARQSGWADVGVGRGSGGPAPR